MRKALFAILSLGITLLVLYIVWFVYLWSISMPIYYFTKEPNSYTANMYAADAELGHKFKANTKGYYIWGYGDSVSVNTDERGFRTSTDNTTQGGLLFFGDSFTLCEELDVEMAYPYKVGNGLCLPVNNAAVSGYGYAQMILQARHFVAEVSPKAVVFQISPWLAERSVTPYMPALFFKVPSPYYNQQQNIASPLYISPVFELTQNQMLDHYRQSEVGLGDKFGFVWKFTRPVFQKQYWEELKLALGSTTSKTQSIADAELATELALKEMIALCESRKLVLLVMGYGQNETDYFQTRFGDLFGENVTVVNADKTLWSQPNITDQGSYERAYCFWHGEPPVLVDYHFNAYANQLISETLLDALGNHLSVCP